MNWNDYILRVKRTSSHDRDDWGVEYKTLDYYDADLEGLKEGDTVKPTEYRGEDLPRRGDPQTYLECLKIEDDRLTFRFYFLENYKGEEITITAEEEAHTWGSTSRSSANYYLSLIPKVEYTPMQGGIKYS